MTGPDSRLLTPFRPFWLKTMLTWRVTEPKFNWSDYFSGPPFDKFELIVHGLVRMLDVSNLPKKGRDTRNLMM